MSMLSSKCDELRKIADELQNLISNGHNYTWSGLYCTLHYAQQGLRDAADTIWELRCKLAGVVDQSDEISRLTDENAGIKRRLERAKQLLGKREYDIGKLRELVSQLQTDLESEFDNAEQMEAKEEMYKAENAKLRELAVGMYGMLEMFDKLLGNHDACETPRPLIFGEDKSFNDVMRELGVEVGDV